MRNKQTTIEKLINIFYNDRQNTIIETYNNINETNYANNIETFENVVLKDTNFIKMVKGTI